MSINVGDNIPDVDLKQMSAKGPQAVSTQSYFAGRKIVLFSVPGAFTPTCTARHLPGYVEYTDRMLDKGIDAIACMAVNDVFVMHAWGISANANGIDMLADGNGEFAEALGLAMDASAFGMGTRSKRFALIADNGIVTHLLMEAPGEFRVSSAEHILSLL